MPQNILIIGATGVIGTPITKAILEAKSHFGRIAILTSAKTVVEKVYDIAALESHGADIITGSLDDETAVKTAYKGIDTVVSCLGRGAIEKQIPLIQWASETNVTRFFPSEYGTDIEYGPSSAKEPPHQAKLKVRAYMKTVKNLEHTYLVTGPYSDLFFGPFKAKPELGSFDAVAKKAVLLGTGKELISFTAMADVGKFVVAALLHPDVSKNATLIVNSFTTTTEEVLEEYEKQTKSKWEVSYTSLEKLKEMEEQAYAQNSPLAALHTLRRIWTEGGTLYTFRDNELLGDVETETVAEQVRQNIEKQTRDQAGANPLRRLSSM